MHGHASMVGTSEIMKSEEYGLKLRLGLDGVADCPPLFSGDMKHRFSDFVVNEIDSSNNLSILNTIELPPKSIDIMNVSLETIKNILIESDWEKIDQLSNGAINEIILDTDIVDKNNRKSVHHYFKSNFLQLCSLYDEKLNKIRVIQKNRKRSSEKSGGDEKNDSDSKNNVLDKRGSNWPYDNHKYVHFTLYKERFGTQEAISKMSDWIKKPVKLFGFAGNKDKQAITYQRVSAFKVDPSTIIRACQINKVLGENCCLYVGNFELSNKDIGIGGLKANRFKIAIRNFRLSNCEQICDADLETKVEKCIQTVAKNGFINYFGLQRFGSVAAPVPSHRIGVFLIKKQYKNAVMAILNVKPFLNKSLNQALELFHTKINDDSNTDTVNITTSDLEEIFQLVPKSAFSTVEGIVLKAFKIQKKVNFYNGLMQLPRNMRSLYIHSYQSYLWNMLASYRISKHGISLIEGDYVLDSNGKPHILTANDIANSTYTFHDLVIQVPGPKLEMADEIKAYFLELLKLDGITFEEFSNIDKSYCFSSTCYRKVFEGVDDLKWKIVEYKDKNEQLINPDEFVVELKQIYSSQKIKENTNELASQSLKGLILEFTLNPSTYATVFLRQILTDDSLIKLESSA